MDKEIYDNPDGIAICGGPLQRKFSNALRLVEHIEIYRLLGVTKQYFYNASVTKDVNKVLKYYEGSEDIEILNFHIENGKMCQKLTILLSKYFIQIDYISEKEIRYYGMFNALTDCIYRAGIVDNFKYVGISDVDEMLMPIRNESLLQLLKRHENKNSHSFVFFNTFFFKKFGQDYSSVPDDSRKSLGTLNYY